MPSRPRQSLLAALAMLVALGLGDCGDSHTQVTTGTYAGVSGANAPYLDVGPLIYEVQLSRELNPYDTEDANYLQGLSPADSRLAPGQEWFGVFLQVFNNGPVARTAAESPTIVDTQGNVYKPVVPDQTNQFAYRAGLVPAHGRLPVLDTVASNGPTQGVLLLYRSRNVSLDNRPLKLRIIDPLHAYQTASAELDV